MLGHEAERSVRDLPALVIRTGPLAGRRIELDSAIVLGRESEDVKIEDAEISRRHATIRPHGSEIEIEDLGSTNGTFVNGARVEGVRRLQDKDVIRLGQTTIEVEAQRFMEFESSLSPGAVPPQWGGTTSYEAPPPPGPRPVEAPGEPEPQAASAEPEPGGAPSEPVSQPVSGGWGESQEPAPRTQPEPAPRTQPEPIEPPPTAVQPAASQEPAPRTEPEGTESPSPWAWQAPSQQMRRADPQSTDPPLGTAWQGPPQQTQPLYTAPLEAPAPTEAPSPRERPTEGFSIEESTPPAGGRKAALIAAIAVTLVIAVGVALYFLVLSRGVSKDEFIEKADDTCRDAREEISALDQPRNLRSSRVFFQDSQEILQHQTQRIRALDAPGDDADILEDWLATQDGFARYFGELAEASGEGDQTRFESVLVRIQSLQEESSDLARDYGFQVCGSSS